MKIQARREHPHRVAVTITGDTGETHTGWVEAVGDTQDLELIIHAAAAAMATQVDVNIVSRRGRRDRTTIAKGARSSYHHRAAQAIHHILTRRDHAPRQKGRHAA